MPARGRDAIVAPPRANAPCASLTSGARERGEEGGPSRRRARARSDRSLAKLSTPSATVMSSRRVARPSWALGREPQPLRKSRTLGVEPKPRGEGRQRIDPASSIGGLAPGASSATRSARARSSRVPRYPRVGPHAARREALARGGEGPPRRSRRRAACPCARPARARPCQAERKRRSPSGEDPRCCCRSRRSHVWESRCHEYPHRLKSELPKNLPLRVDRTLVPP